MRDTRLPTITHSVNSSAWIKCRAFWANQTNGCESVFLDATAISRRYDSGNEIISELIKLTSQSNVSKIRIVAFQYIMTIPKYSILLLSQYMRFLYCKGSMYSGRGRRSEMRPSKGLHRMDVRIVGIDLEAVRKASTLGDCKVYWVNDESCVGSFYTTLNPECLMKAQVWTLVRFYGIHSMDIKCHKRDCLSLLDVVVLMRLFLFQNLIYCQRLYNSYIQQFHNDIEAHKWIKTK